MVGGSLEKKPTRLSCEKGYSEKAFANGVAKTKSGQINLNFAWKEYSSGDNGALNE